MTKQNFKEWSGEVSSLHLRIEKYKPICWRGMNRESYFQQGLTPLEALEKELPVAISYNTKKEEEKRRWAVQQTLWPSNMRTR